MSQPLLAVDKTEVVYERAITAVQGVSLQVREGQIVALLGTNGAGKRTTLRAISSFLGLDDARVTEGSIAYRGQRLENRPPHEITRRGFALVPERDKVSRTSQSPRTSPSFPAAGTAERSKRSSTTSSPASPSCVAAKPASSPAASDRCAPSPGASCASPTSFSSTSCPSASPQSRWSLTHSLVAIRDLGISILLVEQSASVALRIADHGEVIENGRVVLDDDAKRLLGHSDVQEFYLGQAGGDRRSYRQVKQYRRSNSPLSRSVGSDVEPPHEHHAHDR